MRARGYDTEMTPRLPARTPGLLEQKVGEEYVVVQPTTHLSFALSGLSARV
ncbi:MAG: hypothetical protein JWM76_4468 [Pseudonocardiales bacterium]|nr:hypothetical protein [Pseudonocardiales bacterium]